MRFCSCCRSWVELVAFYVHYKHTAPRHCFSRRQSPDYDDACECRVLSDQLPQLSPLIRSLSSDAAKLLVQAFISTRLDYCNSLLYVISDNLYRRLQAVQNAAARLITNTRRFEHITPVLQQLHWLPVRQRVQFKIAVLAYEALHDLLYLRIWRKIANLCLSLGADNCVRQTSLTQWTNTRLGDRSFAAAEPRVWNSLPTQLRESDITLGQFRRTLKMHLFGHWQLQRRVTVFFFVRCIQICSLTYLLMEVYLTSVWSHWDKPKVAMKWLTPWLWKTACAPTF